MDFVNNQFADLNGKYFSELSEQATNDFLGCMTLSYSELSVDATDFDVQMVFVNINQGGVAMNEKHIEYVASIEV